MSHPNAQTCNHCGASFGRRDHFCPECGKRAGSEPSATGLSIPWAVAFVSVVLLVVVGVARYSRVPDVPPPVIDNQSPREIADGYFNQAMRAAEMGDRPTAEASSRQALNVYRGVAPNPDVLFHMGLLYLNLEVTDSTLALADRIGTLDEGHLFGPLLHFRVAEMRADGPEINTSREAFAERYAAEMSRGLEEYESHRRLLSDFFTETSRGD